MAVRKTKKGLALKRWFKRIGKMFAQASPVAGRKGKNVVSLIVARLSEFQVKPRRHRVNCRQVKKRVEYLKRNGWVSQLVNLAVSKLFGEKGESDGSLCFKEIQKTAGLKRWRFRQPSQSYGYGLPDGWECRCEKSTSICAESWKYDAGSVPMRKPKA